MNEANNVLTIKTVQIQPIRNMITAVKDILTDATITFTKDGMKIINSGKKDGLCNLGNSKDEILKVNKEKFRFELTYLLKKSQYVDPLKFFKLVHIAYDRAIGVDNKKDILFYHIHNPDLDTKLNFMRLSPNTKWIMLIREPIQSCESWISEIYEKGDYNSVVSWIIQMIYQETFLKDHEIFHCLVLLQG